MRYPAYLYYLSIVFLIACSSKPERRSEEPSEPVQFEKIVTIGGTITEIVHALGYGDKIIATDLTSTFPESMKTLPSVGYKNNIQTEGLISLAPDLILVEISHIKEDVLNQLKMTGIKTVVFENHLNKEGTVQLISEVANVLNANEQAEGLITSLNHDFEKITGLINAKSKPKVLFVYARGQGNLNIGGTETFAEEIIRLAGGELAVPEIAGFKPLTTEALVSSDPDFILFFDSGLESLGGVNGVLNIKGVNQTNAGKNKQILAMDAQYLSGFGPRLGKAILELSVKLHADL